MTSESSLIEPVSTFIEKLLALDDTSFWECLQEHAKFKDRSHKTHHEEHLPALAATPIDTLDVVLVGASFFERFKWDVPWTQMNSFPRCFNAGVGGDKIENVLYRMDQGLLEAFKGKLPKLWVVSIAMNNLRKKRGLSGFEIEAFSLLVFALLRKQPRSQVLMCALSYHMEVPDAIVDEVNQQLHAAIETANTTMGQERVFWMQMPDEFDKTQHLEDHIHLNQAGYKIWDEKLATTIKSMLMQLDT